MTQHDSPPPSRTSTFSSVSRKSEGLNLTRVVILPGEMVESADVSKGMIMMLNQCSKLGEGVQDAGKVKDGGLVVGSRWS